MELAIETEYYSDEENVTHPISVQGIFIYKTLRIKILVLNESFQNKLDLEKLNEICENQNINLYFDTFEDKLEPILLKHFTTYIQENKSHLD